MTHFVRDNEKFYGYLTRVVNSTQDRLETLLHERAEMKAEMQGLGTNVNATLFNQYSTNQYHVGQVRRRLIECLLLLAEVWPGRVCCCMKSMFDFYVMNKQHDWVVPVLGFNDSKRAKKLEEVLTWGDRDRESVKELLKVVGHSHLDELMINQIASWTPSQGAEYKYNRYGTIFREGKWNRNTGKGGRRRHYTGTTFHVPLSCQPGVEVRFDGTYLDVDALTATN